MPSPLSYRPHFHRDWVSSTTIRRMTYAAQGIYTTLLDAQWEDGYIDDCPKSLQRMLKCTAEEWSEFEPFLDACFPRSDGVRRNDRCHREREDALALVERNRQNGALGGRPQKPKENPDETQGITQTKPRENRPVSSGLTQTKPSGSISLNPDETQGVTQTKPRRNPGGNPDETQTKAIPDTDTDNSPQELGNSHLGLGEIGGRGVGGVGEGGPPPRPPGPRPRMLVEEAVAGSEDDGAGSGFASQGRRGGFVRFSDIEAGPDVDPVFDGADDPSPDSAPDPPFSESVADDDTVRSREVQIRRLKAGAR